MRKTFFPPPTTTSGVPTRGEEFNFECYAHFRAYNQILIERGVDFPPFRKMFEGVIGTRILQLAPPRTDVAPSSISPSSSYPENTLAVCLNNALGATDAVAELLRTRGFVASWERSVPPDDDVEDFSDGADLTYSLALNGDVTLNSQLLLQELGYRLYPSIGRWMAREAVSRCFAGAAADAVADAGATTTEGGAGGGGGRVDVQIDDYYMDTSYNSNPDLFEVKQILLNIVVRRD